MVVKLREANTLGNKLFNRLLELGEPRMDYPMETAVYLPSSGKAGGGLRILLSKKKVTDKSDVGRNIETAINDSARSVGVAGDFDVIYFKKNMMVYIPEKRSAQQNEFLLAITKMLKERILRQRESERAAKGDNGRKQLMNKHGIQSFRDYQQYLSLIGQYKAMLSRQKSVAKVGYDILELKIIRGNLSIILKEDDDPEFTKAAIESAYRKSLDDFLSKLQLQGSNFRLEYVNHENTLYITKRGSDKKKTRGQIKTLELLAGLHVYKSAVLERDVTAKISDSPAYSASKTPTPSA